MNGRSGAGSELTSRHTERNSGDSMGHEPLPLTLRLEVEGLRRDLSIRFYLWKSTVKIKAYLGRSFEQLLFIIFNIIINQFSNFIFRING